MRNIRNYRVKRPIAALLATLCLVLWQAPPAAAFQRSRLDAARRQRPTQTPDAEQRAQIDAKRKAALRPADVQELSAAEMSVLHGRGAHRNASFNGVLPWQRSLRDVNMCNGNLFKSFTDIQVSPARGAGLAWQRTYNSNDERVGPFGVGWTHAYDIRINEAGSNNVPRTDFFGGQHVYQRDADGLYSPPPYLFDELSSNYDTFLADGPPEILSDDQKGMDGTVKHFMSAGLDPDSTPSSERIVEYIEDRHGNQTVFTYGQTATFSNGSTRKLLTEVEDPSGRTLEISWTNLGTTMSPAWRISEVAGPFDSSSNPVYTVSYEYNGDGNLWKVHQDPSGLNRVTTYTYTTVSGESGLMASIADPLGHTVSYTYDVPSNCVLDTVWVTSVTEPGGVSGGTPRTHTWTIAAGDYGGAAAESDGGLCVGVTVDAYLRKVGLVTMAALAYPQKSFYETEYDTSNNVISVRDKSAWTSSAATRGAYTISEATYGPHGNVLTQSVDGFTGTTTTSYYNASKYFQKESVTDPNNNVTTFDYFDNADTSPGNRGEVKWVRDARYGTTGQQFEYTYNTYGQKETETNLNDVVTEYEYADTWGNLTEVVQDPGMGHLNRTTAMTYDVAGRVLSSTDPKSQSSSFEYNGVGQPLEAELPDETVTYTYGANGRTEEVEDGRGTTVMAYEAGCDRIASVEDPVTGTISYTYGRDGRRETISLPGGGTWTYHYLDIGDTPDAEYLFVLPKDDPSSLSARLVGITDDDGRLVEYDLDALGKQLTARFNQTFASGNLVSYCQTEYLYDGASTPGPGMLGVSNDWYASRGWLKRLKNTWHEYNAMSSSWDFGVLVQNDYTCDYSGNRLTNTISDDTGPIRTEEYGYDALSRLTSVDYDDGQTQTYAFDPMGNRTQKADSITGTENYTYNNANMLLTRGSNSYTNDLNGNTLTGGGRTNTWDGENRLTQCVAGSNTTSFVYGCDGLRRRSTVGSMSTDYVLEGQAVVRERQGSSNIATYLQGARGSEYRRNDSTDAVRWYLYDGLGSVLGEVDGNGNVTASRKYDVYGGVRASTGTGTSAHKFVGSLGHPSEDATELVYMRARYCDPVTGRFVSEDPAKSGLNWFNYASNSPTNRVDRDGRRDKTWSEDTLIFLAENIAFGMIQGGWLTALVGYKKFKECEALYMASSATVESGLLGLTKILGESFAFLGMLMAGSMMVQGVGSIIAGFTLKTACYFWAAMIAADGSGNDVEMPPLPPNI